MLQFSKRAGFPGVLGAVDGTHIPITALSQDQGSYCNRHHYHSIILQGVCDANYMSTDVFAGYPGSVHDARVWHNSPLGKRIRETPFELFPDTNTHILEDSAYKCTNYLLTPYKDNGHLTRKQRNFNYKLSSTRVFIE
ncbi:putative nuclease HARBI1 [Photinus pyralis]|nr:putative nuclease HARBI1 [Photinus pyralis]